MNIHKSLHKIVRERERQRRKYQRVKSAVVLMLALFLGIFIGNVFLQNNNISITGFVASGSLPNVGGSTDNWGNILNNYLLQEHTSTGAHGNVTAENLTVDGNVGIGTTSPSGKLEVNGTIFVNAPGDSTGILQVASSPNKEVGTVAFANGGNRRDIRYTDSGISLLTSSTSSIPALTNGIIIDEDGNVGIGTTTPSEKLEVNGTVKADNYTDSNDNQIGAMVLLETQTASNSSSIDFTGIDGTYDEYMIKMSNVKVSVDGAGMYVRFSNDSGSSYRSGTSDYTWEYTSRVVGTTDSSGTGTEAQIRASIESASLGQGNDAGENYNGELRIHGASDSSSYTLTEVYAVYLRTSGEGVRYESQGKVNTAEVNDAVRILMSSGNITSGTFKLYGIK